MNFLKTFVQWLSKTNQERKKRKASMVQKRMNRMACEHINVVEFRGQLYVSYHGRPIIPAFELKRDIEKVLSESRAGYVEWFKTFD